MNTSIRNPDGTPVLLGLITPRKHWSYGEKLDYHYDSVTQTTYYMGGGSATYSKKSCNVCGETGWGGRDADRIQEANDDWK